MATLSLEQMAMYAKAAGLPNPAKWAAIGMAESSGRTGVVNSIGCVGIWQINQPVHVRAHPSWSKSWLKDPGNNARAAKVIYEGQGLGAWEAYTNGSWRRWYRPSMVSQAGWLEDFWNGMKDGWDFGPGPEDLGDDDGFADDQWEGDYGIVTEIGDIAQAVGKAGNWLSNPHNWLRIGYVVGGAVLAGIGLQIVVRQSPAGRKAQSIATGFVGGKVKAATGARKAKKAKADADAKKANEEDSGDE